MKEGDNKRKVKGSDGEGKEDRIEMDLEEKIIIVMKKLKRKEKIGCMEGKGNREEKLKKGEEEIEWIEMLEGKKEGELLRVLGKIVGNGKERGWEIGIEG